MTYGILIYSEAYKYSKGYDDGGGARSTDLFDSIAISADFWPNSMVGWNAGNNGQKTPNWGNGNVVPFVIAKSESWTQEHADAISNGVTAWNSENPSNTIEFSQYVFSEEDSALIYELLEVRQNEIVLLFES